MATPFDDPQGELAWMFLQCDSADGDLDEGFALLSDDFTYWTLSTRSECDKQTLRRAIEERKQVLELTIDLVCCVNEGETVVVEAEARGTTAVHRGVGSWTQDMTGTPRSRASRRPR